MDGINGGNDSTIPNPMFESKNDKESHTVPKVTEENNNSSTKKENGISSNALREKWIMIQQYTHLVPLIISMAIVVAVLQIPTILYYTDPPSAEVTLFDNIDLESCSVS